MRTAIPLGVAPGAAGSTVTLGLICSLLMATAAGAQAPRPSTAVDGRVHVSLALSHPPSSAYPPSLEPQAVELAYAPDLSTGAPQHRELLAGVAGSRVRIGTLKCHRALRLGEIAPEGGDATRSYELWLTSEPDGWTLEAHATQAAQAGDGGRVRRIPLAHHAADTAAPVFTASAAATAVAGGRIRLRWGRHAWSADFRFETRPRPAGSLAGDLGATDAVQSDIAFDNESSPPEVARYNMLAERNETALVLADGSRIGVMFYKGLDVEDEDYGRLAGTAEGEVVQWVRAAPPRLETDVDLRFGRTALPAGNLAAGFAGMYAVWLRRVDGGWRLIFNDEADSWGTQHDPAFDAAEVAAEYSRSAGAFRPLGVTLVPIGESRGRLVLHWGPHEWAAEFVAGN